MHKDYWQNSTALITLIYLSAIAIALLGLLICFGAIGVLIPFKFSALGQSIMLAAAGLGSMWGSVAIWRMGRRASMNAARFFPDGVHFYYGPRETDIIRWSDVQYVAKEGGNITIYAGPDRTLSFDAYMFFGPSRLGRAIAQQAGKQFR